MQFRMLDRIVQLDAGQRIQAVKQLQPEEDYLKDHFPLFPVMPGVLMLEAMFQASMWLVRKSEEFQHSMVVLQETRNVKYADFVEPGEVLTVTSEFRKHDETTSTLIAKGTVDGGNAVSGRLVLERFNLADRYPEHSAFDVFLCREMRKKFDELNGVPTVESVM